MRKALVVAVTLAAVSVGSPARAEHAGCVATTAEPVCTYTALGEHLALGFSQDGWQATVERLVGGVETTVVVGSSGGGVTQLEDVLARPNEVVTLTLTPGAGGVAIGVISSGNTSGHI